jgi:hypothetical protein
MATKVTYYAIVDGHDDLDEPVWVVRRVNKDKGEYDEEFGIDLKWTRTWILYSYERGDGEFYEISEDEANQIVERIRRKVTGEA